MDFHFLTTKKMERINNKNLKSKVQKKCVFYAIDTLSNIYL